MELIGNTSELIKNLNTLEKYLSEGPKNAKEYAAGLIFRGNCFLAYNIAGELRFAPSRFIGYKSNSYRKHINSDLKDGRITNLAIKEIIGTHPNPDPTLEAQYFAYCNSLGIYPNSRKQDGKQRKFWSLNLGEQDFSENSKELGEFPEGKIVERAHKSRERNSKVINIAKANFIKKNGSLFCEVCGFDFEAQYGKLGKDFIEGHHTIAICTMEENHSTKPEDIAMVCSNCHRMLHKRRPWLKIHELRKILRK